MNFIIARYSSKTAVITGERTHFLVNAASSTGRCNTICSPQVRLEAVGSRSDVFQSQVVVHRVSQFQFASQIMLGRLNRHMAKQELNLFKFSPS